MHYLSLPLDTIKLLRYAKLGIISLTFLLLITPTSPTMRHSLTRAQETVTITGQIIPAINTDLDANVQPKYNTYRDLYQPMKYSICDGKNSCIGLLFTEDALSDLRAKYGVLDGVWKEYPDYASYTALWQDWAGAWARVDGKHGEDGVFQVESLQGIDGPHTSSTWTTPKGVSERVEFLAVLHGLPLFVDHASVGAKIVDLMDESGTIVKVSIYEDYPNNQTEVRSSDGSRASVGASYEWKSRWMKVVGWRFYPSRSSRFPELIEAQVIQEVPPPPNTTITPAPYGVFVTPPLVATATKTFDESGE